MTHTDYFKKMDSALKDAHVFQPTLVLDLDRLNENIDIMQSHFPDGMAYRIVAKSLPVPKLLDHIKTRTGTNRLMTFNFPMLIEIAKNNPDTDQLLGKPFPAAAFKAFIDQAKAGGFFQAMDHIYWLVDTVDRLDAYHNIAVDAGINANIVLELDIGLHRGGFDVAQDELRYSLTRLHGHNALRFSGFMGYEPHLASVPTALGWQDKAIASAWRAYAHATAQATEVFGESYMADLLQNGAGSPTYRLYTDTKIINEVSVGSALVKPTDFDTKLLEPFTPTCFIATPVLKCLGPTKLPVLEFADSVKNSLNPSQVSGFFIHGCKWMADIVYPEKMSSNKMFKSSNQEMINGPADTDLRPDDFVFLRPHQSEAVFLQFGDLAIYSQGKIIDHWPSFQISA